MKCLTKIHVWTDTTTYFRMSMLSSLPQFKLIKSIELTAIKKAFSDKFAMIKLCNRLINSAMT